jgi:hypothetical protein
VRSLKWGSSALESDWDPLWSVWCIVKLWVKSMYHVWRWRRYSDDPIMDGQSTSTLTIACRTSATVTIISLSGTETENERHTTAPPTMISPRPKLETNSWRPFLKHEMETFFQSSHRFKLCSKHGLRLSKWLKSNPPPSYSRVHSPWLRSWNLDLNTSRAQRMILQTDLLDWRRLHMVPPDHLLLDSAPTIGPLVSRWELDKFKNYWNKSLRTS